MSRPSANQRGFTLIELVVTVTVLAILLTIAIPTFTDFRQRAAVRGAADQVVSFWGDARYEAVRRNNLVKVGFVAGSAGTFCMGAATTVNPLDDTACDCTDNSATPACDVSHFPVNQNEWRRTSVPSATTIGSGTGVFVIDPKRGNITQAADSGVVSLQSPPGSVDYRLNVAIDRNGRAVICEPSTGTADIPQYAERQC